LPFRNKDALVLFLNGYQILLKCEMKIYLKEFRQVIELEVPTNCRYQIYKLEGLGETFVLSRILGADTLEDVMLRAWLIGAATGYKNGSNPPKLVRDRYNFRTRLKITNEILGRFRLHDGPIVAYYAIDTKSQYSVFRPLDITDAIISNDLNMILQ
jgi:hypothetical protein